MSSIIHEDMGVASMEQQLDASTAFKALLEDDISRMIKNSPREELYSYTPISNLPNELLVSIFHAVLTDPPNSIPTMTAIITRHLMLVCHPWNNIVRETASLWSVIRFAVPADLRRMPVYTEYVRTCVKRSGSCPLDIYIDLRQLGNLHARQLDAVRSILPDDENGSRDHISTPYALLGYRWPNLSFMQYLAPMVALSGPTAARWRTLEVKGASWDEDSIFRRMFSQRYAFFEPTPLLEKLVLHDWRTRRWWKQRFLIEYSSWKRRWHPPFPFLPRITELILANVPMALDYTNIDHTRIKRLDIICHDIASLEFALQCRSVEYLKIAVLTHVDLTHFKWTTERDGTVITLYYPCLTRLEIHRQLPQGFMENIDAPVLQTVVFLDCFYPETIRRCPILPCLKRVELRWPYVHNGWPHLVLHLLRMLSGSCPEMEQVLYAGEGAANEIERALVTLKDEGIVIPRLREIILVHQNYDEDPDIPGNVGAKLNP